MTFNQKTKFLLELLNNEEVKNILKEVMSLNANSCIALGGSWALHIHGLKIDNILSSDIDLIIYSVSRAQLRLLEKLVELSYFSNKKDLINLKKKFLNPNHKSIFDIITDASEKPKDMLYFKISNDFQIPVMPIFKTLEGRKELGREKDFLNNKFLIEQNFK